jgi:SOS-response transcriptional repressor LexA
MSTIAARLKATRLEKAWSQDVLAKKSGVSQGTIGNIESGARRSYGSLPRIAQALGVRNNWLRDGELPKYELPLEQQIKIAEKAFSPHARDHHEAQAPRGHYNVTPIDLQARVPVISWVQAGDFCDSADPYPAGFAEEWIDCPEKHSSHTFAVKVRGLSMYNPAGKPSFSEGDIIFCDPERRAINKSLVICRLDDQPEATFKRLLIEDGVKMLEALNPSWPQRIIKINGNATICGVVFGRYDSF